MYRAPDTWQDRDRYCEFAGEVIVPRTISPVTVSLPMIEPINLRPATGQDLKAVNAVIERAVMSWSLPERVKRLSLTTYCYTPLDLEHLDVVVVERERGDIVGVAAWEPAEPEDTPQGSGLLLHGIYVDPAAHGRGIGTRLLAAAQAAARECACAGILVKAQRGAEGFFAGHGFRKLAVRDPERDYPHRYWFELSET